MVHKVIVKERGEEKHKAEEASKPKSKSILKLREAAGANKDPQPQKVWQLIVSGMYIEQKEFLSLQEETLDWARESVEKHELLNHDQKAKHEDALERRETIANIFTFPEKYVEFQKIWHAHKQDKDLVETIEKILNKLYEVRKNFPFCCSTVIAEKHDCVVRLLQALIGLPQAQQNNPNVVKYYVCESFKETKVDELPIQLVPTIALIIKLLNVQIVELALKEPNPLEADILVSTQPNSPRLQ